MKRRLLLPALCFVAILFSCVKENNDLELTTQTPVAFSVDTRDAESTKLTDTNFESKDVINVLGYLVHDNGTTKYDMLYVGELANSTVSPLSFNYNTSFVSEYYWPKFDNNDYQGLHFLGYFGNATMVANSGSVPYFTYKTDTDNSAKTEDFLVCQTIADKNPVEMLFVRPVSKVIWKIKNLDYIGAYVGNLQFENIISGGTFNYSTGTEEDGKGWSTPEYGNLTINYQVQINGNMGSADAGVEIGVSYLIPQAISSFALVYNYHKELVNLPEGDYIELESGAEYTVTLVVSGNKVIRLETSDGTKQWNTVIDNNDLT